MYKSRFTESFEIGDWVVQNRDDPRDNIYGKVIGFTPNRKVKALVIGDDHRKPINMTLTEWYPPAELIDVSDIPSKFVKKIEDILDKE